MQLHPTLRNNMVAQYETTIGASPILELRTGAEPADCEAADTGTELVQITLPADWLSAPTDGAVTKAGTWSGVGVAAGNAGHYRLKNAAGTVCYEQGSVTATGGGGDMTVDNVNVAVDQAVTITGWTLTMGGA